MKVGVDFRRFKMTDPIFSPLIDDKPQIKANDKTFKLDQLS